MRQALLLLSLLLPAAAVAGEPDPAASGKVATPVNPKIDSGAFLSLTAEATALRGTRLLSPEEFSRRAAAGGAIVLDARSRSFYDKLHVQGASSLPFTEFTAESLARLVPDFDTPILIYCNNNFEGAEEEFATKLAPAALNLSTYVALYTYGYRNVWELGPLVDVRDARLELEGTNAGRYRGGGGTAAAADGACAVDSAGCSGISTQSTR